MNKFISNKAERRKFSATFKTQVAIQALKERETLAELSKRFDIHPNMASKWKQEFIERSSKIFSFKAPEEDFEAEKDHLGRMDDIPIWGCRPFFLQNC